jgi:hypothetical protein
MGDGIQCCQHLIPLLDARLDRYLKPIINKFVSILPDLCRFLSQDCYVDKWKPHTIPDIVDTGDQIVGAITTEKSSNQNKAFAALIAGISDDMRKMMIAYENNRPITQSSTTTQMRADQDDAIAFIEIVIWENELTGPDKLDEAIKARASKSSLYICDELLLWGNDLKSRLNGQRLLPNCLRPFAIIIHRCELS